jgi:hypothetical protein
LWLGFLCGDLSNHYHRSLLKGSRPELLPDKVPVNSVTNKSTNQPISPIVQDPASDSSDVKEVKGKR